MPLPPGLPVVDHHCHLSPAGEGVAAVRRFRAAGGTHLFLATQNYTGEVLRRVEEYAAQFETTEALARQARDEAGVEVRPVVAPYPIDLIGASAVLGLPAAVELQRAALDLAGRWIRDHRAIALGEVGRAHFPVAPEVDAALTEVFHHALRVARDADCPVVLHSADLDAAGYRAYADEARAEGVPEGRLVKHFARQRLPPGATAGVAPSYVARRELVREAAIDPAPWFLETDFLDDPRRPGSVLDLATVPRRAAAIAARSTSEADRLWVPFVESVERVYGWRPEPPAGGSA